MKSYKTPFLLPASFRLALGCAALSLVATASAATTLWSDNFNIPDTGSLDGSDQTGRHTGPFANDIVLRSSEVQQSITNQQLNLINPGTSTGRVRFHEAGNLANWYNFGAGAMGANLLAAGTLRVEFDWNAGNSTSDDWLAVDLGISGQAAGEPALRVNDGNTDTGILFRFRGATQIFDNGAAFEGGGFSAFTGVHHVVVDYFFNSFADGSPLTMQASVDGTQVWSTAAHTFDWNANGGVINLEVEAHETTGIDNLTISSVPEPTSIFASLVGGVTLLGARRRQRAQA